jgi:hypothetical protein
MRETPRLAAVVAYHLHDWGRRPGTRWAVALAAGLVAARALTTGRPAASLFRAVLGGPAVAVLNGHIVIGPGWTWFLTGVLFVVSGVGVMDRDAAWTRLALTRRVSRRQWIAARLLALALGAVGFLTLLLLLLAAVVMIHPQSGPLFTAPIVWDVGLWALGLIALAWTAQAFTLVTRTGWWSLVGPLVLLGLARFGGSLSPYLPFAQWMVGLHDLPGTLSVTAGAIYVALWVSTAAVLSLGVGRAYLGC